MPVEAQLPGAAAVLDEIGAYRSSFGERVDGYDPTSGHLRAENQSAVNFEFPRLKLRVRQSKTPCLDELVDHIRDLTSARI